MLGCCGGISSAFQVCDFLLSSWLFVVVLDVHDALFVFVLLFKMGVGVPSCPSIDWYILLYMVGRVAAAKRLFQEACCDGDMSSRTAAQQW